MNIAFITWKFPCLANTFILYEITELIRRGNQVTIFSIENHDEQVVHAIVHEFGLLKDTYYLEDYVPTAVPRIISKMLQRTFQFCNSRRDLTKYAVDDMRERIYSLKPLAQIIENKQCDIIHGAFGSNSATTAMLLSRLAKIPYTFESHALDLFVSFRFAEEKLHYAEKIFAISHYNKKYLIKKYKCPESKIIIKRVPFLKDYCDKIKHIERDENLIVSACRLHPIKGLEHAIDAINILRKYNKELKYVIIGDGELKESLREKVRKIGLEKQIIFTGNIPNHQVLEYMKKAALYLQPSVIASDGDRDGIPTSLIESMYLETPAVTSKVSGIPELVTHGVNGFFAEQKDVNDIADKIQMLLSNPSLRAQMGKKAKQAVEREFDIDKNMEKLLDAWTSIIEPGQRPSACIR